MVSRCKQKALANVACPDAPQIAPSLNRRRLETLVTPPAGPDFIPYKANQHRSDANTRQRKH